MSKYTHNKVLNRHGLWACMLFIAELNGFKSGTVKAKVQHGITCYLSSSLHEPDYSTEAGRSEAHENIWLERIYNGLDQHFQLVNSLFKTRALANKEALHFIARKHSNATFEWNIPLELDASASMLQYIGLLLNDERLLSMTNVIGKTLSDPWAFEGIPRTQFKHAATPMLYGSSRACHELWQNKNHAYTLDQIQLFNAELQSGALGVANAFKEFLITNCKPSETMQVRIFDEEFTIQCNRFSNKPTESTTIYKLFDTQTSSIRTLHHTTPDRVADLEQFRRYFVTLLIHNLDSQVANHVAQLAMEKYGWCIDIHDAFIVHPNMAKDIRKWYSQALTNISANRKTILANYFQSIGIGPEAQAQWDKVTNLVHQAPAVKASPMSLK